MEIGELSGNRSDGLRSRLGKAAACVLSGCVFFGAAEAASGTTFTAACSGNTGAPASLVAAIDLANATPGSDTVALGAGCIYTLTTVDNYWYGPNGLPPIASQISIEGHGSTITRAAGSPHFRLFFVGADSGNSRTNNYVSPGPGVLILRQLTLTGGVAKGGDSSGGGGGAGMGGAIFNQGTVLIDHSTLAGNTAQGGSADTAAGIGGGGIGSDSPGTGAGGGFGTGIFGQGATGGSGTSGGGGGGAGFRHGENGGDALVAPGAGGGALSGLGGFGGGGGYGGNNGGEGGFGGGGATKQSGGGGGAGMGGAIFNMQGQLGVINSTITGNSAVAGHDNVPGHAKGLGGAVFNLSGAVNIDAATFGRNNASFDGSSIYNLVYDSATTRAASTTLIDSLVDNGAGSFDASSVMPNTTTGQPNLGSASLVVSQFDLVRSKHTLGPATITGSPLTADPLLGPLKGNGGPTATVAPAAGSPVIDASHSCPATDQRGLRRPDGGEGACDIGAYEVQDPVPGVTGETLSPSAFAAAPRGPSAAAAKRRFGAKVRYTLNVAASVRFTVIRVQAGRRGKGRNCVKPTRRNRKAGRCGRLVPVAGSFKLTGRTGSNSFHFSGRISGHKLASGRYRLIATPSAGGLRGRAASAAFRIT